jgi:hypothetical protein
MHFPVSYHQVRNSEVAATLKTLITEYYILSCNKCSRSVQLLVRFLLKQCMAARKMWIIFPFIRDDWDVAFHTLLWAR